MKANYDESIQYRPVHHEAPGIAVGLRNKKRKHPARYKAAVAKYVLHYLGTSKYQVSINLKKLRVCRRFGSLSEAVAWRDEQLARLDLNKPQP